MRENNCLTFLKDDLNSLYSSLGKDRYLKDDLMYIEKSYKTIEKIWKEQYDKIKAINYIMISEAPLFGEKQSYFYNENANQSQFFYFSDSKVLTNNEIKTKRDLIDTFNDLGIIILDVFPFPFNSNTAVSYKSLNKNEMKTLIDLTYKNHLEQKLQTIAQKVNSTTKLFYRYKRVKNSINDFIAPEFAKYGINTNQQDIPYISKRGGGIDHKVLEKIFSE